MSSKGESLGTLRASGRARTVDDAVLANIRALGPICRDAVCRASGVAVSTACGAIDRLMKRGEVIESTERVWNASTRRNVKAYIVTQGE